MKTKSMVVYTTTLLACIIFGFNTTVYAQYHTPPVLGTLNTENGVPNFGNNNVYDKTYYLTHPIIGWNWAYQLGIIDEALHMNAYHGKTDMNFQSNLRNQDDDMILYLEMPGDNGYAGPGSFNTQCMWYHPELTLDTTNNFQPINGDPNGAVYGWRTKALGAQGTGQDQWRWVLQTTGATTRQLVLSDLW